jgi:hypothetical protein
MVNGNERRIQAFLSNRQWRDESYLQFLLPSSPSGNGSHNCHVLFLQSKGYSYESVVRRSREVLQIFPQRCRFTLDCITIGSAHCDIVHVVDYPREVARKFDQGLPCSTANFICTVKRDMKCFAHRHVSLFHVQES